MPGPYIPDPTPDWLKPENASVTDSALTKAMRRIAHVIGADNPSAQVVGLMTTDVPGGPNGGVAGALGRLVEKANTFIKAYHGSPHDFERFSMEKIGTGEGAQAYGHGLYFAESPATAEAYRAGLAGYPEIESVRLGNKTVGQHNAFDYSPRGNSNYENIQSSLFEDLLINQNALVGQPPDQLQAHVLKQLDEKIKDYATEWPEAIPDAQRLRADLSRRGAVALKFGERPGASYEVAIKADPEMFLDWDKPFAEQSPKVQEAIRTLWTQKGGTLEGRTLPPFTAHSGGTQGESIHAAIATSYGGSAGDVEAKKAAAEALKSQGVAGIKYLDQVSRGQGYGSRNYVVFDDKLVDILKKYGVAGAAIEGLRRKAQAQGGSVTQDDIVSVQ